MRHQAGRNVKLVTQVLSLSWPQSIAPIALLELTLWTKPVIALTARRACTTQKLSREIAGNVAQVATHPKLQLAAPFVPPAPIEVGAIRWSGMKTSTARTLTQPLTRTPTSRPLNAKTVKLVVTPKRVHLTAQAVQPVPISMNDAWTSALIADLVSTRVLNPGFARIALAVTIQASAQVNALVVQRANIDTSATTLTPVVHTKVNMEATVFIRFRIHSLWKRNRTKYPCVWAANVWTVTQDITHQPSPSTARNAPPVATRIQHQFHVLFVRLALILSKPVASAKNAMLVNTRVKLNLIVVLIAAPASTQKLERTHVLTASLESILATWPPPVPTALLASTRLKACRQVVSAAVPVSTRKRLKMFALTATLESTRARWPQPVLTALPVLTANLQPLKMRETPKADSMAMLLLPSPEISTPMINTVCGRAALVMCVSLVATRKQVGSAVALAMRALMPIMALLNATTALPVLTPTRSKL